MWGLGRQNSLNLNLMGGELMKLGRCGPRSVTASTPDSHAGGPAVRGSNPGAAHQLSASLELKIYPHTPPKVKEWQGLP